jgi:hypothetical protein
MAWGSTEKTRRYLRTVDIASLSDWRKQGIEAELPKSWQKLIDEYGHERVFRCLRANMTIGGAQRELRQGWLGR